MTDQQTYPSHGKRVSVCVGESLTGMVFRSLEIRMMSPADTLLVTRRRSGYLGLSFSVGDKGYTVRIFTQ